MSFYNINIVPEIIFLQFCEKVVKAIAFIVETSFVLIELDDMLLYTVFVSLRNKSNEKVHKDNEDKQLIDEPYQLDGVNHEVGEENILAFLDLDVPEGIYWILDVSDGDLEDGHENEITIVDVGFDGGVVIVYIRSLWSESFP